MQQRYGWLVLVALALTTACSDSSGPRTNGSTAFSRQITFPALKDTLQNVPAAGAARVGIELPAGSLVAHDVDVENAEQVSDAERVRSRISDLALNAAGDTGTLTLAPGFKVTFTAASTFSVDDSTLTFQQFVDTVKAALALSPAESLGVRAERSPMNPLALGPGDAFPAAKLELNADGERHAKLRLNVTQANLVDAGSGDCTAAKLGIMPQGCLELLGVTIGIAPETDIDEMNPGVERVEFEGVVDCAQPIDSTLDPDGSFFLKNGPQVLVNQDAVQASNEDHDGGGTDGRLTLAQVATACAATPAPEIRTEGEGVLASSGSTTIRATEVQFQQQEQEGVEVELSGAIGTIDQTAMTFTIGDRTIAVDGNTRIEHDGNTLTLADLKAGDMVEVRGALRPDGTVLAAEITIES